MRLFWVVFGLLIAATAAVFLTGGRDAPAPAIDTDPVSETNPASATTQTAMARPASEPDTAPAVRAAEPPAPTAESVPDTEPAGKPLPEQSADAPSAPPPLPPIITELLASTDLDTIQARTNMPREDVAPEAPTENSPDPALPVTGSPDTAKPVTPEPATAEAETTPAHDTEDTGDTGGGFTPDPTSDADSEPAAGPETETESVQDAEREPAETKAEDEADTEPEATAESTTESVETDEPTTLTEQPETAPASTEPDQPSPAEPKPDTKTEPGAVVETPDGLLLDGHWKVPGKGTPEAPYQIDWDMLVAVQQDYKPRLGQSKIPDWINALHGKTVTIRGYALLPTGVINTSELLVMLNEWDSCCIGVPPTPYDAIEVRLAKPLGVDTRAMFSHTGALSYGDVTGTLEIDPYIVQGWLLGLYLMEDANASLLRPAGTP